MPGLENQTEDKHDFDGECTPIKIVLYMDGSAGILFENSDVHEILKDGWCSLHNLVKKHPHTPIYLGEHYQSKRSITKSDLALLLKCIREKPGAEKSAKPRRCECSGFPLESDYCRYCGGYIGPA